MDELIDDMTSKGLITVRLVSILLTLDTDTKLKLYRKLEIQNHTSEYIHVDMFTAYLRKYGRN